MGWSCSVEADATLTLWSKHCLKTKGSQNTYEVNGVSYFFDVSRTEYDDGRITGQIFRMLPDGYCRLASSFRINGDGTVARAPAVLKALGVGKPPQYGRSYDGRILTL